MKIITAAIFFGAFFAQTASAAGTCYSYSAYDDASNDVSACFVHVSYSQLAPVVASTTETKGYNFENEYAAAI
jgi:hypothetical protein